MVGWEVGLEGDVPVVDADRHVVVVDLGAHSSGEGRVGKGPVAVCVDGDGEAFDGEKGRGDIDGSRQVLRDGRAHVSERDGAGSVQAIT